MTKVIFLALAVFTLSSCIEAREKTEISPTPAEAQLHTQTIPKKVEHLSTTTTTQIPTYTNTPMEIEEAVLQRTAQNICPFPDQSNVLQFFSKETSFSFLCATSPGHSTWVNLERFPSQAEAEASFNTERGDKLIQDFHGYPVSIWHEDYPSLPGGQDGYHIWIWQANRWLITVRAFDDTHFPIAPSPATVSEALYQYAKELGLFSIINQ